MVEPVNYFLCEKFSRFIFPVYQKYDPIQASFATKSI